MLLLTSLLRSYLIPDSLTRFPVQGVSSDDCAQQSGAAVFCAGIQLLGLRPIVVIVSEVHSYIVIIYIYI